jgi:hypothetical protein
MEYKKEGTNSIQSIILFVRFKIRFKIRMFSPPTYIGRASFVQYRRIVFVETRKMTLYDRVLCEKDPTHRT